MCTRAAVVTAVSVACTAAFAQTSAGPENATPPAARPNPTMTAPQTPPATSGSTSTAKDASDMPRKGGERGTPPSGVSGTGVASYDKKFMTKAAEAGMAEVELGKLASEKATSPDVKRFAQQMVDEHSKANEELKGLAARKNVSLPTEPNSEHRRVKKTLEGMAGPEFDRRYMAEAGVKAHKESVDLFKNAAASAHDPEVKSWAASKLQTIQQHDQMAHGLADQKGATSSRSGESKGTMPAR
ncbi:MAG TPA: DUF4142 domain-containing protein [Burkholderiaceae bacterium]|nr:DUF4142 domain-containing protein [Burkholderiaceae bacterium]